MAAKTIEESIPPLREVFAYIWTLVLQFYE